MFFFLLFFYLLRFFFILLVLFLLIIFYLVYNYSPIKNFIINFVQNYYMPMVDKFIGTTFTPREHFWFFVCSVGLLIIMIIILS